MSFCGVKQVNEVEVYYNEAASKYENVFDIMYFKIYDAITWKYLEPYIPSSSNALILDAGGGTGRWSIRIAKKGCRVVLLDASEGMLNVAKEKVIKEGLQHRISIEKGDIRKLNYPDATFDMVLCEHALFLLDEPNVAIKEFGRVLKKGAPLVVSAQNRYVHSIVHLPAKEIPTPEKLDETLDILLCKKYDAMSKDGKVKIYTWTPDEFRNLLEGNEFNVEKIVGKGMTMPLRITDELYRTNEYPEDLFNKILQLELALCEKPDALALAGHLQAIAYKL